MALPYATNALIRIVTDKVLENVARQMGRPGTDAQVALQAPPPDLAAALNSLNAGLVQLQRELAALEDRLDGVERRMAQMQRRWGWTAMAKVVLAVAVAFILGFAMAQLLRLGGWMQ